MSTNYSLLLSLVYPGSQWTLYDVHNFDSLAWMSTNSIPKPSLDQLMADFADVEPIEGLRLLRIKRNELLKESDVYVLLDFPHPDESVRHAWLVYRQALRDLPLTSTPRLTPSLQLDEAFVTWPPKPDARIDG